MAQKLQQEFKERSGLFQYVDLGVLTQQEQEVNHEDDRSQGRQPEEEPNRRINTEQSLPEVSSGLVPPSTAQMDDARNTPIPESPSRSHQEGSAVDHEGDVTPSMQTDQTSEAETDPMMEPVYNAVIAEHTSEESAVLDDDTGSYWDVGDSHIEDCVSFSFDVPRRRLQRFCKDPDNPTFLTTAAKRS